MAAALIDQWLNCYYCQVIWIVNGISTCGATSRVFCSHCRSGFLAFCLPWSRSSWLGRQACKLLPLWRFVALSATARLWAAIIKIIKNKTSVDGTLPWLSLASQPFARFFVAPRIKRPQRETVCHTACYSFTFLFLYRYGTPSRSMSILEEMHVTMSWNNKQLTIVIWRSLLNRRVRRLVLAYNYNKVDTFNNIQQWWGNNSMLYVHLISGYGSSWINCSEEQSLPAATHTHNLGV